MSTGLPFLVFLCVVVSAGPACAGAATAGLFDDEEVLELRLAGPLRATLRDVKERALRPFTLSVHGRDLAIQARVRGNSRSRICEFPPLRLEIPHSEAPDALFREPGGIKMVTHCRNNRSGNVDVLEEYAAYRIFNLLSDFSYRVRLLSVEYANEDGKPATDPNPGNAFLIEPSPQLQARLGGEWAEVPGVRLSELHRSQAALVFVFHYLIGNTDWSLVAAENDSECCHNTRLLAVDESLYLIPYDFDLAGLVNAAYAKPDPKLRIKRVTTRRYRGFCIGSEPLRDAIRRVVEQEEAILAVLDAIPAYPESAHRRTSAYLSRFFTQAEDEVALLRYFEQRCMG